MTTAAIDREYRLSRDGVASIQVLGGADLAEKCLNLVRKAELLERCGFLFPRRNLVVTQDALLRALERAGLQDGWTGTIDRETRRRIFPGFQRWALEHVWPLIEAVFRGRALYIRSDAPGDSLGRGVYHSIPFVNRHIAYRDQATRALAFANIFFEVVMCHYGELAIEFRRQIGREEQGLNVFFSQFIGRVGEFLLGGGDRQALAPFLSAVVKSTLVAGRREGLIRFEYGLGSGALVGRTIITNEARTETLVRRRRIEGPAPTLAEASPEVIVLPTVELLEVEPSNWPVIDLLMSSAYPLQQPVEQQAKEMLTWLVSQLPLLERLNDNVPLYLELVSSSFMRERSIRWFVVQVADFQAVPPLPPPRPEVDFVVSRDFSGHGLVEGCRSIYIFGKQTFTSELGTTMLTQINEADRDYVVVLPQHAFTGLNLNALGACHFSNAAAVIEYERLTTDELPSIWHQEDPSSEHFEQLMLDFQILFIPVDCPFPALEELPVAPEAILGGEAEVSLACDKERGVAWGKIADLQLGRCGRKNPRPH